MDELKDIIERALKDDVLVVKVDGVFYKNPPMSFIKKLFMEKLTIKFRKIIGPDNPENKFQYMQELHGRGRSVHVDMRWTLGDGKVSGVTIACPFSLPSADEWEKEIDIAAKAVLGKEVTKNDWDSIKPRFKHQIREELQKKLKASFFTDPFVEKHRPDFLNWERKHVFIPKAMQDMSWFEQPYIQIPPGFVGATRYSWAVLAPFDRGEIEFGVIKPDYMEIFIYSENNFYNGKVSLIFLPREQVVGGLPYIDDEAKLGNELWVGFLFTTKSALPYMLSERAIEEDFITPVGVSALPKIIRSKMPKSCQYWLTGSKEMRDEAVAWAKKNLNAYVRKTPDDVPKKEDLWQF